MNGRPYEVSVMILGIAAIVLLYFFTSIFWPFIVPVILIFRPLKNMLISGLIGLLLFAYFIVDIEILLLFPYDFYFFGSDAILGENNLVFVRIANNVGLAISMFMIYLFISEKLKRHGAVR